MAPIAYAEVLISTGLYIYLGTKILTGNIVENFATWSLWSLLDIIATASLAYQHGNFTAVATYAAGGTVISFCILRSKKFSWKPFDSVIAGMVVICIIVWALSGPKNATIASTAAVAIATGSLIKDIILDPMKSGLATWVGFLIVNILGVIEGKEWSITERFYPTTCMALCTLLCILTARKYFIARPITEQ